MNKMNIQMNIHLNYELQQYKFDIFQLNGPLKDEYSNEYSLYVFKLDLYIQIVVHINKK